MISACTPRVNKTNTEDALNLVEGLTYTKAKNELCFGVCTVSRLSSGVHKAINQIITYVPCKEVGL